jgi:hypothetical protein
MKIIVRNAIAEISEDERKIIGLGGWMQFTFEKDGFMSVTESCNHKSVADAKLKCSVQQFAQAAHCAVDRRPDWQPPIPDREKSSVRERLLEILQFTKSSNYMASSYKEFTLDMPEHVQCSINVTKRGLRVAAAHAARRGEQSRKMTLLGLIS